MTNENLIDKGIEKLREIEKSEDDIEKKLSNMSEVKRSNRWFTKRR
jgi:hypothetical protein